MTYAFSKCAEMNARLEVNSFDMCFLCMLNRV